MNKNNLSKYLVEYGDNQKYSYIGGASTSELYLDNWINQQEDGPVKYYPKIVEKYGDKQEDETYKVAEVHTVAFSEAITELLDEEFEIKGIKPIKFPKGLKLSPMEMGLLENIIDMEDFLDDEDE